MDLDLTEEQQMIIDMTRGLLEEYSNIEIVREMEDDPKGYPDALWKQMGELGLNGLLIPESYGGGGQTLVEARWSTKNSVVRWRPARILSRVS